MKKIFLLMSAVFLFAQINYKLFIKDNSFNYKDNFSVFMTAPWGNKVKNNYSRKDTSNLIGIGFNVEIDKIYLIELSASKGILNIKENKRKIKINNFFMSKMIFDYIFYNKNNFYYNTGIESIIWNGKKGAYQNRGDGKIITLGAKFITPFLKNGFFIIKAKAGLGSVESEIGSEYYLKTDNNIDLLGEGDIEYQFNIKNKNFFIGMNSMWFLKSDYDNYSFKAGMIFNY